MEKMKKLRICVASGLAFATMFGGIFVATQSTNAEDAPAAITASSLWEPAEGITLTDNVDVPDYMRYGKYSNDYNATEFESVLTDEKQNLPDWQLNGLQMKSTIDNQSITYKHTLDLNGMTKDDEFLTFAPIPVSRGTQDFVGMDILLQDVEDPDNYINFNLTRYILWTSGIKIKVQAPQIATAGHNFMIGFNGLTHDARNNWGNEEIRHRPIKLRFDSYTKAVSLIAEAGKHTTLIDLDDESKVGYGKAWKGFTSNRVKLTVTMNNFESTEATILMLNVCGQGMNGATLTDTTAPKFSFAQDVTSMPKAQVGKKYPLVDVQCWDVVSGQVQHDCTIVSPSGKNVEIVDNGFLPTESGYYTLTYTATDLSGNTATKELKVISTNALSPIQIEAETLSGTFSAGENISVYPATAEGGSGPLTITTDVFRVGGGENVTISNSQFKPMLGGTYCVRYTATDYLGNTATKTVSYEVVRPQSVFVESITEVKRLFEGAEVCFPEPIAYDYTTRPGSKLNAKYEISVYDKNNAKNVLTDGVFMPDSEKYGESVKVEYVIYTNDDETRANAVTYTYDVPLYAKEGDARRSGQVEDYFVYDKSTFKTVYNPDNESEFLKFYTKKVGAAHSVSFANPLLANGFYMAFAFPANEQNYGSITISFRDSINSQIGFDLELVDILDGSDKDKKTYVLSGGMKYAMNGTGNTIDPNTNKEIASKTPLSLTYKDGKVRDYNDSVVLTPTVNFDGKAFNGFPSDKVYVTFTFNNVTGPSSLLISQLYSQMLYVEYDDEWNTIPFEDTSVPTIVLSSDIRNDYHLDEVVNVPSAIGFDLFTPNIDVYVTVQTPSGRKVYDKVPATEGLSFVLDSLGRYTITYEADDGENGARKVYTVRAKDFTAPLISIPVTELKGEVGKEVAIPTAILLDDQDQNPRLFIMVVTPRGTIFTIGERTAENAINSYTFTEKGKYYIRYCAFDTTYNMSFTDIPVVIS